MKFRNLAVAVIAILSLGVAGCGSDSGSGKAVGNDAKGVSLTVGSANFPENVILANIYAEALRAQGATIKTKLNIGSREKYYPALKAGSINLFPEYTGTLLTYINKNATQTSPDDVYTALGSALPANLVELDKAEAQDSDAVVVTKATADKYGLKTIADLAKPATGGGGTIASKMIFGGPPEFKTRADGVPGLQKHYGVTFQSYKVTDTGGPVTVGALKRGQIDAADLFTTDPSIKANDFVALEDPKSNFAAQNIVPIIGKSKATAGVKKLINGIQAKLTDDSLGDMIGQVANDHKDAAVVAKQWLKDNGFEVTK
jgi:osmoprotectant transport system substrate-binding protein